MLGVGRRVLSVGVLGVGVLGVGCWVLGVGCWVLSVWCLVLKPLPEDFLRIVSGKGASTQNLCENVDANI